MDYMHALKMHNKLRYMRRAKEAKKSTRDNARNGENKGLCIIVQKHAHKMCMHMCTVVHMCTEVEFHSQ